MKFLIQRKQVGKSTKMPLGRRYPSRREIFSEITKGTVFATFGVVAGDELERLWAALRALNHASVGDNRVLLLAAVRGMPFAKLCDDAPPGSIIHISVSWLDLRVEIRDAILRSTERGVKFRYAPLKLNGDAARARYDQLRELDSALKLRARHERSIEAFQDLRRVVGAKWLDIKPQARRLEDPFFLLVPPEDAQNQSVAYIGRFFDGDRNHPYVNGLHEIVHYGSTFEQLRRNSEQRWAA